jgi:secreted trypsin-like serine protease
MRRTLIVVAALALLLGTLFVQPSGAITDGRLDGNRHPNVGALIRRVPDTGEFRLTCSGTLIATRVLLTAAHCTASLEAQDQTDVWVTFDTSFDEDSSLIHASWVTHPGFDSSTGTLFNDVAVVLLDRSPSGITPARLPRANFLNELKSDGDLIGRTITNVGYGVSVDFTGHPPEFSSAGTRRFSTSPVVALRKNNLMLLMTNPATGQGGTCSGDSGGPHFLGRSDLIVSVTSWGDAVCRSLDVTQRVDIPSVRNFLDDFVTLS